MRPGTTEYRRLHKKLGALFPKSGECEACGVIAQTDYALIHGRVYTLNRDDYRELCRRCHVAYDEIGGSRWRGVATARHTAGEAPPCACGCGTLALWSKKKAQWLRFATGHYDRTQRARVQREVV